MHEVVPGARLTGEVLLDGAKIFELDPVLLRRRRGDGFSESAAFPTMEHFDNVAAGLRLNGMTNRHQLTTVVEQSLKRAALWDEVKDISINRARPLRRSAAAPLPSRALWR